MLPVLRSHALRPSRTLIHRTVRFSRRHNGVPNNNGPHTTYFQPPLEPPKTRWGRITIAGLLLVSSGFLGGVWISAKALTAKNLGAELQDLAEDAAALEDAMAEAVHAAAAKGVPPMDLERSQEMLETRAGYSVNHKVVAHTAQLPSNLPCEDQWSCGAFDLYHDPKKDWAEFAIFDGHAGPRMAMLLRDWLPGTIGQTMWSENCFGRPYVPNDPHIIKTIKNIFYSFDNDLVETGLRHIRDGMPDRAAVVAAAAAAFSGSCALLALYDPAKDVLRVANVGDSRAVLGRWDGQQNKYIAQAMSIDQTGFNQDEVKRINADHPDEEVIDHKTGRIHGLAVSRAFGDARWKWPQDISRRAHELFWGPNPRPDAKILTPPYLTAEPEIMETKVRTGDKPDFLIMASDGLWDQMSNDDAVICVQMWLDKNKPTDFATKAAEAAKGAAINPFRGSAPAQATASLPGLFENRRPGFTSPTDLDAGSEDEEVYYDADERTLKWKVSPKHFVVEDENCGIHLIKNALGGRRRDLFMGVMSVQPPLSRNVRDDITVHVIFFGQDADLKFLEGAGVGRK
ncbi:hypothetical protein LTR78_006826 [Recurvomyces mirabilis]|uniref:PPM-type phosphatase domain-containing protein n=1 Tax=Recurvomyces mirabilis TaxID=574656 RepID=A0AAE1BZA1_9PEZI|nr:hypothetical protein LTR78_006826 [Recurvomyces mirabilis]KAK5153184.1 hypothetical protein LTS14_007829 [Recurvomyces mirabilis]